MTEDRVTNEGVASARSMAAEFRLRPEQPRVTRLSRKVLVGLGAATAVTIGGVLIFALQDRPNSNQSAELYNTDQKATADGLASLPRDYAGVPRDAPALGPPLPGDLGRPILRAQDRSAHYPGVDPVEQHTAQEDEAARVAKLFVATETQARADPLSSPPPETAALTIDANLTSPGEAPIGGERDRKLDFVTAPVDRRTISPDRLTDQPSPYVLHAGTAIPAALITGIRSDLPGQVTAQVTENVYDSPTGRHRLIPQGARLIGEYDSQVSFGQSRVLLVWNRLILPDGRSIVLERQPGADTEGFAGLEDRVDHHWRKLFTAAALSTLLGVGAELGTNSDDSLAAAFRDSIQDTVNQTGQQIVRRQLDVQPTLTIRPGFPVRVILTRDLVLEPNRS